MQVKWLEDFLALVQTRSFTRAAELRHVTHPAFGRRIAALESWAGTPLVARGGGPVQLTAAGEALRESAEATLRSLLGVRENLQVAAGQHARTVVLATGRTLARTLVPDWLVRARGALQGAELRIRTHGLAGVVAWLEQGEVDFALLYHHSVLAVKLDARRFTHVTVATDRLVPLSRADVDGKPVFRLSQEQAVPYLAYAPALAMGRLVEDHLANLPAAPRLERKVECDSADAQYEYVERGLGVAWLPWSMAHAAHQSGLFARAAAPPLDIRFEVRLYRPKRRLSASAEALWKAWTP
ncbi:MAG: LysR family transcriptional regulator [Pseudomonadota bacterium]